ncbi:MarR family winged helix-turn-helix transcriptional regulator [Variovorax sp. PMC12]|uniref:MarR family winged helix-turn-helix transcriptional regulator n=1 Tax=Variovorax sp. PMC12 TaxID=2126319 RepID=UPI000D11F881|nr:MarR family winged helix-turn-helix transcriptional regulator [Variovorax sp. PMC12]AVQ80773.1 hypothetical protein C4F17_07305 [Variovorax sp. PMC12]
MSRQSFEVDRIAINKLMRILDTFRQAYPGMTADQAMTLLWIASEPDNTQIAIADMAGISRPAISRHVEVLGPPRTKLGKQVGADLVTNDYAEDDHRKKVLRLTASGEKLVKSIQHLLK